MKKTYPIAEIFHSLKGEGIWTGYPMTFIRLAGCNLACEFCDTDISTKSLMTVEEIIKEVKALPQVNKLVITGGEPLIHDLEPLLRGLDDSGTYAFHLETNGTLPVLQNWFNWIAVSPKGMDLSQLTIHDASEIKFLVGCEGWEEYIAYVMTEYKPYGGTHLMVMPIAHNIIKAKELQGQHARTVEELIWENVELAKQFCYAHPDFQLCMQMHKILGIR